MSQLKDEVMQICVSLSVFSEYRLFVLCYTCMSSQDGDSALMEAASENETEVVVKLIEAGANLNLQNEVQRLCTFTTYMYIRYMIYMNKTTLHVIFRYSELAFILSILSHTIHVKKNLGNLKRDIGIA